MQSRTKSNMNIALANNSAKKSENGNKGIHNSNDNKHCHKHEACMHTQRVHSIANLSLLFLVKWIFKLKLFNYESTTIKKSNYSLSPILTNIRNLHRLSSHVIRIIIISHHHIYQFSIYKSNRKTDFEKENILDSQIITSREAFYNLRYHKQN